MPQAKARSIQIRVEAGAPRAAAMADGSNTASAASLIPVAAPRSRGAYGLQTMEPRAQITRTRMAMAAGRSSSRTRKFGKANRPATAARVAKPRGPSQAISGAIAKTGTITQPLHAASLGREDEVMRRRRVPRACISREA